MNIHNNAGIPLPAEVRNTIFYYCVKFKIKEFMIHALHNPGDINKDYKDYFNIILNFDKTNDQLGYKKITDGEFTIESPNMISVIIANTSSFGDNTELCQVVERALVYYSLHMYEIEKGEEEVRTDVKGESLDMEFLSSAFKDIMLASTNKLKDRAKSLIIRKQYMDDAYMAVEQNLIGIKNELSRLKLLDRDDSKEKIIDIVNSIKELVGKVIDSMEIKDRKMIIRKDHIILPYENKYYYYGSLWFSISLPALQLKVEQLKEFRLNEHPELASSHLHPHISEDYIACLGKSQHHVDKFRKDFNLVGYIVYISEIMNSFNINSPYTTIFLDSLVPFETEAEAREFGIDNINLEEGFKNDKFHIEMPLKRLC